MTPSHEEPPMRTLVFRAFALAALACASAFFQAAIHFRFAAGDLHSDRHSHMPR